MSMFFKGILLMLVNSSEMSETAVFVLAVIDQLPCFHIIHILRKHWIFHVCKTHFCDHRSFMAKGDVVVDGNRMLWFCWVETLSWYLNVVVLHSFYYVVTLSNSRLTLDMRINLKPNSVSRSLIWSLHCNCRLTIQIFRWIERKPHILFSRP